MEEPKILIVDDSQFMIAILTDYLSSDYDIISSTSGESALEKVKEDSPDLILLDVILPNKSGIEVCEILKSNEKTLSIPIIMVTTLSQPKDRIEAIEAGADDFITKPVDQLELSTRVKSLLRIKRLHDNLMVERDRLDIKNSILSVLTQIIPILMQTVPPQQQVIVIHQIIDRVEQIISDKLELELETMDMAYCGNKICDLWNQLGGSFTVDSEVDKKITIKGTECPWGNEARKNPILCQLTRGIFSRIAMKKFPYVEVQLVKSLGNRDDCCLIEITQ